MARNVLVDAGFLVALLSRRDSHHPWAATQAPANGPPWRTCEAVLSEAFHLLGVHGAAALSALLRRRALIAAFDLENNLEAVLKLFQKYRDLPMSLADACLVRMTETLSDPVILTTDPDFRIYRRHSRHIVPGVMPPLWNGDCPCTHESDSTRRFPVDARVSCDGASKKSWVKISQTPTLAGERIGKVIG